jgi:transposase
MHETTNKKLALKIVALLAVLNHTGVEDAAATVGMCAKTVYNAIARYKEFGVEGLIDKPKSGRPPKLTKEQLEELADIIKNKLPKDVGFDPSVNWTFKIACKWVRKTYRIKITVSGMERIFSRIGLSWTRPACVLKKSDPN